MRVLFANSFEYSPNVLADSSFTLTRRIIEQLDDRDHAIFVLPDDAAGGQRRHVYEAPIPEIPRCEIVKVPMYASREVNEMYLGDRFFELFNPIAGERVDYDCVFTNNAAVVQRLVHMLGTVREKGLRPPVVMFDYSTATTTSDCEQSYLRGHREKVMVHYLGYLNADLVAFPTEWTRNLMLTQARALFSPAVYKDMARKAVVCPMFFSRSKVDETLQSIAPVKKRETPTIYWGGRFTATKRVALAAEVANYMFSFGRKVDMVFTVPGKNVQTQKLLVGPYKVFPEQFEYHAGLPQEEAWKIMASCHVSIFAQSLRFGPAAPIEQIRAGLIVLINRKDAKGILPDDYPWFWASTQELHALVRRVVDHYDEEVKKLPRWQEYVGEHLSLEVQGRAFFDQVREIVARNDAQMRDATNQLVTGRLEEMLPGMTWQELRDKTMAEHPTFKQLKATLSPPGRVPALWPVFQYLRVMGALDASLPMPTGVSQGDV